MCIANISLKLLLIILLFIQTQADSSACEKKEKLLTILDLAKELISKARNLQPACLNDSKDISSNSSECGAKEKASAYLDIATNLIEGAKQNYSTCDVGKNVTKVVVLHKNPSDCSEVMQNGDRKSGRYTIWPKHRIFAGKPLEVFCDMETDGGGWTVIQRRGNFSKKVDFHQSWDSYKNGFGNISEEFWIGNDKIFELTHQAICTLRFDLESVEKEHRFATYSTFWIEDEKTDYTLHFGDYNGTAGDGLQTAKNMKFSTKEKSNICAKSHYGGWWYNDCGYSNPNGVNQPGVAAGSSQKGMFWYPWTKFESLRATEIKIRPEN